MTPPPCQDSVPTSQSRSTSIRTYSIATICWPSPSVIISIASHHRTVSTFKSKSTGCTCSEHHLVFPSPFYSTWTTTPSPSVALTIPGYRTSYKYKKDHAVSISSPTWIIIMTRTTISWAVTKRQQRHPKKITVSSLYTYTTLFTIFAYKYLHINITLDF